MPTESIPKKVRKQVEAIVDRFNRDQLGDGDLPYAPRFRGRYLYLNRMENSGSVGPICRLEYTGSLKKWQFAIYKYSSERYDPEERMFPGEWFVDGTIEGAMKAGLTAYR